MKQSWLKKLAGWKEIAMAAAVALFYVFFIFPGMYGDKKKDNGERAKKIAELKTERQSLEQFVKAINKPTESGLTALKADPNLKIKIMTGEQKNLVNNIADFLAVVTRPDFHGGIIINEMAHEIAQPSNGYEGIGFKLRAHGSFQKVVLFLKKIEGLDALVTNEDISITVGSGGDIPSSEIILDLKGNVYRMNPNAVSAASAAPAGAPAAAH